MSLSFYVRDDQELVVQIDTSPRRCVGVVAGEPKFRPVVVTDVPPLRGPFREALLTTGPSKVKPV